jgi:hypothetical protein
MPENVIWTLTALYSRCATAVRWINGTSPFQPAPPDGHQATQAGRPGMTVPEGSGILPSCVVAGVFCVLVFWATIVIALMVAGNFHVT